MFTTTTKTTAVGGLIAIFLFGFMLGMFVCDAIG